MKQSIGAVAVFMCVLSGLAQGQPGGWAQSKGPYGGFVNTMVQTRTGELLAGTFDGIFASSDEGLHWSKLPALPSEQISSLLVTSKGTILATTLQQVLYSQDNGATWFQSTGLGNNSEDKLIREPNGSCFAIGTDIYETTDHGISWFPSGGSNSPGVDAIGMDSSGVLYATNFGTFLTSTDSGASWTPQLPGLPTFYCNSLAIDHNGVLYAATDSLTWRSTDQGRNWTPMNVGTKAFPVLVLSTVGNQIYGAGEWEFYQSSDEGTSWNSSTYEGGQPSTILSLSNSDLVLGTLSGVLVSTNHGSHWATRVSGMTNTLIGPVVAKASGDVFAAAAAVYGGVYHSSDNGDTWSEANLRTGNYAPIASMALLSSGAVLAGTRGSGLFRTSNNAASWQPVGDLPDSNILALAVGHNMLLSGTLHRGAFLSSDSGDHWSRISDIPDTTISTMAIDSSGTSYIATSSGNVYRAVGPQGPWTTIAVGGLSSPIFYTSAAMGTGIVFFAGQFTLTSFDGTNWKDRSSNLPNDEMLSLTTDADTVYATFADSGIYRSTDFGASWRVYDDGLKDRSVNSLSISPNGYFFAGTYGDGVYRAGSLRAGVSTKHATVVSAIAYPNPASNWLTFEFSAETPGRAILNLFDVLGNKRLSARWLDIIAGSNERSLDVSGLAPGIYSYTLIAGSEHITGKVTLLK